VKYLIEVSDVYGEGLWYRAGEKVPMFLDEHDTATQVEDETRKASMNIPVIATGRASFRVYDQVERRHLTLAEIHVRADAERAALGATRQKTLDEERAARGEIISTRQVCPECKRTFESVKGLKLHRTKSHGDGRKTKKRERVSRPELQASFESDSDGGVPGRLERPEGQERDLETASRTLSPE